MSVDAPALSILDVLRAREKFKQRRLEKAMDLQEAARHAYNGMAYLPSTPPHGGGAGTMHGAGGIADEVNPNRLRGTRNRVAAMVKKTAIINGAMQTTVANPEGFDARDQAANLQDQTELTSLQEAMTELKAQITARAPGAYIQRIAQSILGIIASSINGVPTATARQYVSDLENMMKNRAGLEPDAVSALFVLRAKFREFITMQHVRRVGGAFKPSPDKTRQLYTVGSATARPPAVAFDFGGPLRGVRNQPPPSRLPYDEAEQEELPDMYAEVPAHILDIAAGWAREFGMSMRDALAAVQDVVQGLTLRDYAGYDEPDSDEEQEAVETTAPPANDDDNDAPGGESEQIGRAMASFFRVQGEEQARAQADDEPDARGATNQIVVGAPPPNVGMAPNAGNYAPAGARQPQANVGLMRPQPAAGQVDVLRPVVRAPAAAINMAESMPVGALNAAARSQTDLPQAAVNLVAIASGANSATPSAPPVDSWGQDELYDFLELDRERLRMAALLSRNNLRIPIQDGLSPLDRIDDRIRAQREPPTASDAQQEAQHGAEQAGPGPRAVQHYNLQEAQQALTAQREQTDGIPFANQRRQESEQRQQGAADTRLVDDARGPLRAALGRAGQMIYDGVRAFVNPGDEEDANQGVLTNNVVDAVELSRRQAQPQQHQRGSLRRRAVVVPIQQGQQQPARITPERDWLQSQGFQRMTSDRVPQYVSHILRNNPSMSREDVRRLTGRGKLGRTRRMQQSRSRSPQPARARLGLTRRMEERSETPKAVGSGGVSEPKRKFFKTLEKSLA